MTLTKRYLKIADFLIELTFQEPDKLLQNYAKANDLEKQIRTFFKDYAVNETEARKGKIDFRIIFKYAGPRAFLQDKKNKNDFYNHFFRFKNNKIITYTFLSINQFNYILLRFVLSYLLNKTKGFFLHCSANTTDTENGVLFLGKSGAGKSTISRLLNGAGLYSVADDGVIMRKMRSGYHFFPLARLEKKDWFNTVHTRRQNRGYKLRGIYFLVKDSRDVVKKIAGSALIQKISPLVYNFGYYDGGLHFLDLVSYLNNNHVSLGSLHFSITTKPANLKQLVLHHVGSAV